MHLVVKFPVIFFFLILFTMEHTDEGMLEFMLIILTIHSIVLQYNCIHLYIITWMVGLKKKINKKLPN